MQYFVFLCSAGHYGDDKYIFGVDALFLGVVSLNHRAEHLLRGLASGEVFQKLGIIPLTVTHPTGGAGGNNGQFAAFFDALDKLVGLLHDRQVSPGVHVKDPVKPKTAEGGEHFALGVGSGGHSETLAQCHADGGRCAYDHMLLRVRDGGPDFTGLVLFGQSACWAGDNTLAAGNTGGFGKVPPEGTADMGVEAAFVDADDGHILMLFAYRHTAAAEDAFGVVPYKVGSGGFRLRFRVVRRIPHLFHAQNLG
jgi:hypothetical protein